MSTLPFEQEALVTLVAGPDAVQAVLQSDLGRALTQLPVKENGRSWPHDDDEFLKQAVALGFVIGERVDDLFIAVAPPAGWTLKHRESYHSDFLDAQGRVRGYQFYKGAFYDREAFASFRTRYKVDTVRPDDWFARLNPSQPEPLFTLEEKTVTLRDGERPAEDDVVIWGRVAFSRYGAFEDDSYYQRGPTTVRRKVKVLLPEEQQPARVLPQGFDESVDVIDTVTGLSVWKGEVYHHPHRDDPAYRAFIMGDGWDDRGNRIDAESKGRQAAVAWADENLPRWRDVAAYWDEELPHGR